MKGINKKESDNSSHKMTRSEKAAKKASGSNGKKKIIILSSIALVVCLVLGLGGYLGYNYIMENRKVEANISIIGVQVQGMTRKEVSEAVSEAFLLSYRGKQMVVKVGDETITLTPEITNVNLDADRLAKAALSYSSEQTEQVVFSIAEYLLLDKETVMPILQAVTDKLQSTLVQNSYTVTGKAPEKYDVIDDTCNQQITFQFGTPGISINPELIYEAIIGAYAESNFSFEFVFPIERPDALDLEKIFADECMPAVDAVVDTETWQVSDEAFGYGFDMAAVAEAVEAAGYGDTLTFDFVWIEPKDTKKELTDAMFCDVLGQVTASSGWNYNRNTNIRLSSEAVNGTILLPGQVFSFNQTTGQRTKEKGYLEGGAYVGGEVVSAIGGGICQVSSAIYYASVLADMEIVERYNHAFATGYLPNGTDATVSWGYLDFKFKNNTDRPIKIEAIANGGTVTVRILGVDTRDYYVKFVSENLKVIPYPVEEVEYPPDNPEGYKDGQVISKSSPCVGFESKSYRNKYDKETNQLISSTLENYDKYGTRKKVVVKIVDPNPPTQAPDTTPDSPTDPTPDNPVDPNPDVTPDTPGGDSGSTPETPPSGGNGGITEDGN